MNKTVKNLLRALYFIFTFGLGILLALTLPGIYAYDAHPRLVNQYLNNHQYELVFNLTDAYYLKDPLYTNTFDDGTGIVMCPGVTTYEKKVDNVTKVLVHEVYSCYFYNVPKTFEHQKVENNQTKLTITSSDGKTYEYKDLLNYSSSSSSQNEAISSLLVYPYIYFEVPKGEIDDISKIKLTDMYGNTFKEFTIGTPLTYSQPFFTDVNEFVEEFNKDSTQEAHLKDLQDRFLAKDTTNYKTGGSEFQKVKSDANKRAIIWVVVYFVLVYIFYDITLGARYLIKGPVALYKIIRKKYTKEEDYVDPYGTDYYSQLTLSVTLPDNVNEDVIVKFKNTDYSYEVALNVFNKYTTKIQVHAGKYSGLVVKSNTLELEDSISSFQVKGYTMELNLKMRAKSSIEESKKEK